MIEFLLLCEKNGLTTSSMTSAFNLYLAQLKNNQENVK